MWGVEQGHSCGKILRCEWHCEDGQMNPLGVCEIGSSKI